MSNDLIVRLVWLYFEDVRLTLYEIVKEQKTFFAKTFSKFFGPERGRTAGLLLAKQALYQLSYRPR